MKTIKYILAVCALVLGFQSCCDEPDKYETTDGVPTIRYIRNLGTEITTSTDPSDKVLTNGQLVESASPEATLCIVGDNLRSIVELYFNDKPATLNSSYITDNTMIVVVPKEVPTAVTNLITMKTADGQEVTHPFKVVISAPVLNSADCEYKRIGETMTIRGRYLIPDELNPLKVEFTNAAGQPVEAEVKNVAEDFTSVTFVVPEGAVEGPITVTSVYGATKTSFNYLDSRGFIFDFDGRTTLSNHGWHSREIKSDEWSICGNYMQLGNGEAVMTADGAWDDGNFSFEYWPGNWKDVEDYADDNSFRIFDVADCSNWQSKTLKFEMCVPKNYPWKAGAMQIAFAGVDKVSQGAAGVTDIYGNTLAGCNNVYFNNDVLPRAFYRPWLATGSYDTNDGWVTVSLPLATSLTFGFSGAAASGSLTDEDFASFLMFVTGGEADNSSDCTPIIKIDNIRIVPNK